jgi:hypothetical protein
MKLRSDERGTPAGMQAGADVIFNGGAPSKARGIGFVNWERCQ